MCLLYYRAPSINWRWKTESIQVLWSPRSSSVGGIHCIDVAVQLVSERKPGLGGEIDLGTPIDASCSFALTAPGCRRGQTWLHLLHRNWRGRALPALAALFAASVEGKALQHLHTHDRDAWGEKEVKKDINISELIGKYASLPRAFSQIWSKPS